MTLKTHTFLDTDMHIFRYSADDPVRDAALEVFRSNKPTAMSAFSLVELKGNYIQDLILLRRKISESISFRNAASKVMNSGGRKSLLMMTQLIYYLGGFEYSVNPWPEPRRQLLTHLDAQLAITWQEFKGAVNKIYDDFDCSRAHEPPDDDEGTWRATLPKCRKENTKCSIVSFMGNHINDLKSLLGLLDSLDSTTTTRELQNIRKVLKRTINSGNYQWEENQCRSMGDLLIGLQSKIGIKLVSSNRKEHQYLSAGLKYVFEEFPIAKIRSK